MSLFLGRELKKDEDVHHRDGDKLNFELTNLCLMDHSTHGWFSAKQHWYMKQRDRKEKENWDAYFAETVGTNQSCAEV